VIIPVHNDSIRLNRTLSALEDQSFSRDRYEVIVVNNGAVQDLVGFTDNFPHVVFTQESRRGSYRARNTGLRLARGQVTAFTDSDCIPDHRWIEAGARAITAANDIGLVGGSIDVFSAEPEKSTICELYDMVLSFPQDQFIRRYRFGVTANLFTTKQVFNSVGSFKNSYRSGGDCEWGYRVHKSGFRQVFSPAAVVRHPARKHFSELVKKS